MKCEEDSLLLKEISAFLQVFEKNKLESLDRCQLNDFANQADQLIYKIHKMGFLAVYEPPTLESFLGKHNQKKAEKMHKKEEAKSKEAKKVIDDILNDEIEYEDPVTRL